MSVALLIARCALALVFVIAALGKLADRPGLRATLTQFGLPRRLVTAGALALPLLELAIGVLLIPSATARPAALVALALLVALSSLSPCRRGSAGSCSASTAG